MSDIANVAAKSSLEDNDENMHTTIFLSKRQFGARLRMLRLDRNLTQAELAKKCGWIQSRIGNYEQATRETSFADINSIAKSLDVLPQYLLFG